ncbi:MAG: hypothetical protein HWN71_02825 [Desulfobacterales bacterium]|nr:hypothetical protein [Desulfobacterales bacterium]
MIKYYNYALVYHNYIPGSFIRGQKNGDSGNSKNRWAGKAGSPSLLPPSFDSSLSQPKGVAALSARKLGKAMNKCLVVQTGEVGA